MTPHASRLVWALRAVRLIGLVLLVFLLARLDWTSVVARLLQVQVGWLVVYLLLFPCSYVVRSARLSRLVSAQHASVPKGLLYRFSIEAGLFGSLTPGRFGELAKVGMLRSVGVPTPVGLASVVFERAADVGLYGIMGVAGAVYFLARSPIDLWPLVASAVALALLVAIAVLSRGWSLRLLMLVREILMRRSALAARALAKPDSWRESVRGLRGALPGLLVLSVLILAINLGQIYTLAQAVRMTVGFPDLAFAYSIASLVVLLPISIGGLGTREATYVVLLGTVGATQEATITFSLLDGTVLPLLALALLNALAWFAAAALSGRRVLAVPLRVKDERG